MAFSFALDVVGMVQDASEEVKVVFERTPCKSDQNLAIYGFKKDLLECFGGVCS